jgi:hypothetical protein
MSDLCPLSEVKWTWAERLAMSAFDPKRTWRLGAVRVMSAIGGKADIGRLLNELCLNHLWAGGTLTKRWRFFKDKGL